LYNVDLFYYKQLYNVDLFYYNQPSLLHVSATHCGHLQGGVLWRNITQNVKTIVMFCVIRWL